MFSYSLILEITLFPPRVKSLLDIQLLRIFRIAYKGKYTFILNNNLLLFIIYINNPTTFLTIS